MSELVHTISTPNVEMDYIKFGSGKKTFVILPGLSIHSVMGLADAVATAYQDFTKDYTVYLFDRAKNLHEGYTIRDIAKDTASAMMALNLTKTDIFGASQGAMATICLAMDYPELVHGMVLGSALARSNKTFATVVNKWVELAEKREEKGLLENFLDVVYSQKSLEKYRDAWIAANVGITQAEYERFLVLARACQGFDVYEQISAIQCPALVLGSEGDRVVTSEGSREIAEKLGCEIYLYDASYGHAVYDEAPDYKKRILDFFSACGKAF